MKKLRLFALGLNLYAYGIFPMCLNRFRTFFKVYLVLYERHLIFIANGIVRYRNKGRFIVICNIRERHKSFMVKNIYFELTVSGEN